MGKTQNTGRLTNGIFQDSSNNIAIGDSTASGFKFKVTGTSNLNGALSGTSATFSGLVVSNLSDTYPEFKTSPSDADVFLGFSNTGDGNNGWGVGRRNTGEFWITNFTGNFNSGTRTTVLSLASTGAATFSSSVTAGGGSQIAGNGLLKLGIASGNAGAALQLLGWSGSYRNWQLDTAYINSAFNITPSTTNGGTTFSTPALTILSDGNVGIGTSSPSAKVYALGNSTTESIFYAEKSTASFTGSVFTSLSYTASGTGWNHFLGYSDIGGTLNIKILGNGNIQNANNSYGAISDIKLKENITDASPKLDDLLKVKVRNYNLIGDESKQLGVIAQELEQVFPSMIEETNDIDKDGNYLGTTTKSVKYSVFVPMLVKAIQEQNEIITKQGQAIEELKALIAAK